MNKWEAIVISASDPRLADITSVAANELKIPILRDVPRHDVVENFKKLGGGVKGLHLPPSGSVPEKKPT